MSMRRLFRTLLVLALLGAPRGGWAQGIVYPETPRLPVIDDYHGVLVPDPYRWLEDLGSEQIRRWIEAQNRLTFAYLDSISQRVWIRERLTQLWDYPRFGVPQKENGRYFFFKNEGLQNQPVLYVQQGQEGTPRVLIDPNTLSEDGTVALTTLAISRDGRYVVYGLSEAGSDWRTFRIRDVESGTDFPETLRWIKFSGAAWLPDNQGFFYSRYPEPTDDTLATANRNQKLYFHRLGTDQSADVLIYERPDDPELGFNAEVTRDGRYLILNVWKGTDTRNRVYYKDLAQPDGPVVRLLDDLDARYTFVGNKDATFYFLTNLDAPNGRLIAIDITRPDRANWRTLIPESEAVLQSVTLVGGRFVVQALQDVKARLTVHALDGSLLDTLALPTIGSVSEISGQPNDPELFFSFTSFIYPTVIFRHDLESGTTAVFHAPEIDFDASQYEVRQVFYRSKDGTRIPMFLVHRKGLVRDGSHPVYLYGYGGFNISLTPSFNPSNLVWLELGGIYAVANLRGGGEYGEAWHRAGMLKNKQNVFDDMIAAAEYLIQEGYTSPKRLAIGGASNGGLLTGAVLTQRPELLGGVIVQVGVLDMLRYHRFTIGWAWIPEYGSPENPEHFDVLYAYSPLHNVRLHRCYPPTLIMTADHDDRVVPAHSYKFAATLQRGQGCAHPVLLRVETRAGHGGGIPTQKRIEMEADKWAFLVRALNISFSPKVKATDR